MQLTNTGNLLIGSTSNTGERLQVTGTMKVTGNLTIGETAGASTITLPQTSGFTDFVITNAGSGNGVRFRNSTGTRTFTISGANLDIATSTGNLSIAGQATIAGLTLGGGVTQRITGFFGTIDFLSDLLMYSRNATQSVVRILSGNASASAKGTTYISDYSNLTTGVNASATLQLDSTVQGFLPPRMTTTQKNAISSPAAGLVVYDTTLAKLCVYTTAWETITSA